MLAGGLSGGSLHGHLRGALQPSHPALGPEPLRDSSALIALTPLFWAELGPSLPKWTSFNISKTDF